MFGNIFSQIVVVAVPIVIGAFLWLKKPFWAKSLGALAFAAATIALLESPAVLVVVLALGMMAVVANHLIAHRKKCREAAKREEELRRYGFQPRRY